MVTEASLVQPEKALSPMRVTLAGISMLVRLEQLAKAYPSILVMVAGSSIVVRPLLTKAHMPMLVTPSPTMSDLIPDLKLNQGASEAFR